MKTVINPAYEKLRSFVESLPREECPELHVYCNHRNKVFLTEAEGERLVVKRYKRPTWINMVVYTYFRLSKPRRAYEYAFKLKEAGIETPEPVAYIESRRHGLFHTGWFVSRYLDYRMLTEIDSLEPRRRDEVADAFARFSCRLHESGFLPHDYATANVMYDFSGPECRFALVDINSMSFGKFPRKRCARSIKILDMQPDTRRAVISRYAALRGWDGEECYEALVRHRAYIDRCQKAKRCLKRALGIGRRR